MSDFEDIPRDKFDDFFGDGSLNQLKSKLVFDGQEPEILEAAKGNGTEDGFQTISFVWGSSFCKIVYSRDVWNFVRLEAADTTGLFSFLTSVLPEFAASKGVKNFICFPENETAREIFLNAGFSPDANGDLSSGLLDTSKLQQYGEWVASNKNPELEPSWRKENN